MNRARALSSPAWVVSACGAAIALLFLTISLIGSDGDPSGVARFGELTPQQTDYAQARLDRAVFVRDSLGHDGKFFFIQANDPLLLAPDEHASALDRPTYRSQRMLYPLLAGAMAGFNPHLVLWTLIAVNISMMALGSWAVAMLAVDARISSWFGLAFAVNMGLVYSLLMDGATVTAFALACLGVLAVTRQRTGLAVLALTAAVLAREVMILFAFGVVIGVIVDHWRKRTGQSSLAGVAPWSVVIVPGLAAVMWAGYVRLRITFGASLIETEEITLVPLSGTFQALTSGSAGVVDLLAIVLVVAVAVAVPLLAMRTMSLLVWGAVPFSVLAVLLTVNVWQYNYNITRALAPLLTAVLFGIGVVLRESSSRRQAALVPLP